MVNRSYNREVPLPSQHEKVLGRKQQDYKTAENLP